MRFHQRQDNHLITVIHWVQVEKEEIWTVHQYRASEDEFHINFSRNIYEISETIVKSQEVWIPTIQYYASDTRKTKWNVALKKQSHKKENTDCNVNNTRISNNPHAFNFVISKIICLQKKSSTNGFQPPLHKVNANIYINDFFSQEYLIIE